MSKHQLICVSIIELDSNGEVMETYRYPAIPSDLNQVIQSRSPLFHKQLLNDRESNVHERDTFGNTFHFMYSKYQDVYLYTCTVLLSEQQVQKTSSVGSVGVTSFSICLCAKDYFPKMYQSCLTSAFARVYLNSGFDPVQMLQAYISVFGSGKYRQEFSSASFDKRMSKVGNLSLLVSLFGGASASVSTGGSSGGGGGGVSDVAIEEAFCRIWTAVLLRKRVLVYSDKIYELNMIVDAFPCLCWHRANSKQQFNQMIRPFVNLNCAEEVKDLENMGVFIAGVNTEAKKSVKYDLFVDVSRRETIVSDQAANDFRLTKIHRDMFAAIQAHVEEQEKENEKPSNQALIRIVAEHTQSVIEKLKAIKESNEGALSLSILQTVSKQPDTQRFLYNIAQSEGLLDQHQQPQQEQD